MTDYRQQATRGEATFEYDAGNLELFQPIENYGIIGNARTSALVAPNGSIDWACFPRPDSEPVFFSLLDRERGGRFAILPATAPFTSHQAYENETNVLRTDLRASSGVVRLTDFMPYWGDRRAQIHEIHRRLVCLAGEMDLEIRFRPRLGWGDRAARLSRTTHGVVAYGRSRDQIGLFAHASFELDEPSGEARARVHLRQGEGLWLVCAWNSGSENVEAFRSSELLERTRSYWREWVGKCNYHGSWRGEVVRSALALRLLFYEPSGAMIAAPTTSLPETIGGERNWDYRYTWIRDSAYAIRALSRLGYSQEAINFAHFLEDTISRRPDKLRLMYSVTGEYGATLSERTLDHLEGYQESRPVRVGNGAAEQMQADIFGAMLDAAFLLEEHTGLITMGMWRRLRQAVNGVCRLWKQPDHGLWEARVQPRHYTYSKMQCWVAIDRGIRLSRKLRGEAFYKVWRSQRDQLAAELLSRGYDEKLGSFVQSYESKALDASSLTFGLFGLLAPDDPRMLSTIDRIRSELAEGPFVWRYRNEDGQAGQEGAFLLCSFWLVQALATSGQLAEAVDLHRQLLGSANHLGLLAEQFDPVRGRQLGNFPQSFSHLGLMNATVAIHDAMMREEHGQAMSWLGRAAEDRDSP